MHLRIFNFFKKTKGLTTLQEQASQILEEVKELKKQVRKQNVLWESMPADIIRAIAADRRSELEHYCDVADALFYYEASLQATDKVNPEQEEALAIIWDKLDDLLSLVGLKILRRAGGDFDARIYEAIENRAAGTAKLLVAQVLQPGYIFHNTVLKPAKVTVDKKNHNSEG